MDDLIISNLSKTYSNGVMALNNISLKISAGMFGLLGPNGAGKSTLMRTIATLQDADKGSISFGNLDIQNNKNDVRKILGYLPQEFGLYPSLTAQTLLNHFAVLKGINRSKERKSIVASLLDKTNLYEHRKKKLGGFSGGMKRRFGIAQALLRNPKLIIVDEPTAGLDPTERNRFHNLLCELGENRIVILSTHIVDDVKELCQQMAIIKEGQVLLEGNPIEAISQIQGNVYSKAINKYELSNYKNEYEVIAEKLLHGQLVIHILHPNNPHHGFEPIKAELSDVYFSQIFNSSKVSA